MRKHTALLLALMAISLLSGCGRGPVRRQPAEKTEFSSGNGEKEQSSEVDVPTGEDVSQEGETLGKKPFFDLETKTVILNSGYEMPLNGLGTYSLHGDECINSVTAALDSGVRLIDTAHAYENDVICCEV